VKIGNKITEKEGEKNEDFMDFFFFSFNFLLSSLFPFLFFFLSTNT